MSDPIQAPAPTSSSPTAGVKSSEFWLTLITVLGSLGAQVQGVIPEPWGTIVAAVLTAVYTVARVFIKAKAVP